MRRQAIFPCGVSALALVVASSAAFAQTSLPSIDIGKARQTKHAGKATVASKARSTGQPSRSSGRSHGGSGSVAGAGSGLGAGGDGTGAGAGSGAGGAGSGAGAGYGGQGPAQDPYNKSYTLENASVGTKTDTPVMETPLNVQSVTQQVIRDQQLTDLAQALKNVSGVTIAHGAVDNGNPYDNIQIRGFSSPNVYRDGFRTPGGYGSVQFADVASIEVLKGPGATLYGISEPGGLVNYVTKQPLDSPYYAVNQQVSSLAVYRTSIDATGPLTADKAWLYRMDMSYENNGSPFGSQVDDTRSQTIFLRPVIKWNVDNDTWVRLEALYNDTTTSTFFPSDPIVNGHFANIPRSLNYGGSSPTVGKTILSTLTWSHKLDQDWSITQQFAFWRQAADSQLFLSSVVGSASNWPLPVLSDLYPVTNPVLQRAAFFNFYANQTFSTNVAVQGRIETVGVEHKLLFGGDFYKNLAYSQYFGNGSSPISPISLFNPVQPGLPFLPPSTLAQESTSPEDDGGLFVQDQMKLPYDFFLTASARYQYVRQNGGESGVPSFAQSFSGNNLPRTADTLQAVTPRFGLLWRPASWVSGYIHYAEGFGPNSGYAYPLNPLPPTNAREAEAGVKFELLEGKLRATAALYDLTKTNVPEVDTNPLHVCPGGQCFTAIGAVRAKGPELDIQGELLPGLSLILAYTNQDVIVTKTNPGDTSNKVGQPFPITPRNIASLQTTYEFQGGPLKGLTIGGGYYYYGAVRAYDQTGLNLGWLTPSLSGYGIVNLLAHYSYFVGDNKINFGVNVNNLFDRTYYTAASYGSQTAEVPMGGNPFFGFAPGMRIYGAPFSVLGHVGVEFPGRASRLYAAPSAYLPTQADWSGGYVGGQIGMAWGDNVGSFSYVTPDPFSASSSLSSDAQGVLFGAHVGYNHQFDSKWVVGLEGSVDGTNLAKHSILGVNNNATFGNGCFNFTFACLGGSYGYGASLDTKISSDIQGAVRTRLGYAWNRLLFYGAGGVALANFNHQSNLAGLTSDGSFALPFPPGANPGGAFYYASGKDSSSLRVGWTLGGGLEYAINSNWSVRADYRYTDFGHIREQAIANSDGGEWFKGDRHLTQNQLQVGFSYRFADPDPEPAPGALIVKGPAVGASLPLSASAGAPPKGATLAPVIPVAIDWTGFYVGGQAGYAYGDNHGAYSYEVPGFNGPLNPSGALIGEAQGVIFGAHLGYNLEFNKWVMGLEGAVDGTNLNRRNSFAVQDPVNNVNAGALQTFVQSEIQGAVRGRAGYAFGRFLPFVAGGVALGEFSFQSQLGGLDTDAAGDQLFSYATKGLQSMTRVGWTAGGGVEWAVNNHWSVRGEYRFSDFGTMQDTPTTSAALGAYYAGRRHLDQNQVQFGFDYKFGAPPAPLNAKF